MDQPPVFLTQILLRRLHPDMAQQELDLLQFSSRYMAQTSAGAPQIMRGQVAERHTEPYVLANSVLSLRLWTSW